MPGFVKVKGLSLRKQIGGKSPHLPRGPGGNVLDDDPVIGAAPGWISAAASAIFEPSRTPAVASGPLLLATIVGQFDPDPVSVHILSVEIGHGIFGVPVILEIDEPVPVLDGDLAELPVAPKEPLHVPGAAVERNVAQKHSLASRHDLIHWKPGLKNMALRFNSAAARSFPDS